MSQICMLVFERWQLAAGGERQHVQRRSAGQVERPAGAGWLPDLGRKGRQAGWNLAYNRPTPQFQTLLHHGPPKWRYLKVKSPIFWSACNFKMVCNKLFLANAPVAYHSSLRREKYFAHFEINVFLQILQLLMSGCM